MKSKNMKSKHHDFVADLVWQIKAAKLPMPEREVKFHPTRRWRFDLAWTFLAKETMPIDDSLPERSTFEAVVVQRIKKIALEVEGAVWSQGRHTRGSGFVKDMEKYNEAALLGWIVYRVSTNQVTSGEALKLVEKIFNLRGY